MRTLRLVTFFVAAHAVPIHLTSAAGPGWKLRGSPEVFARVVAELTARQALDAMNRGWLSSSEYVEILLARIDAHPEINAFIHLDPDAVRTAAAEADASRARGEHLGPLHGLPILLKDSIQTADGPTTAGTPALSGFVAGSDAPVLQTLLDAGAFVLGKTNVHELSAGYSTNNAFTGPTRNPYDLDRIPGGSSGGNGAALAARFGPVALGEDTGGSIRVPAALTGTTGFRPTTGRYPGEGVVPLIGSLDTVGPMGRDVLDLALIDGVLTGEDELPPVVPEDVRVGVPRAHFHDFLDPEVERAFAKALRRLRASGMILVPADIPLVSEEVTVSQAFVTLLVVEPPRDLSAYLQIQGTGVSFEELVASIASPDVAGLFALMASTSIPEAVCRHVLDQLIPAVRAAYVDYLNENDLDVVLYPTTIVPPPGIGQETVEVGERALSLGNAFLRQSHYAPLVSAPTLTLPMGQTTKGLPVGGLDVAGRPGDDRRVLAIGHAISKVLPRIRSPLAIDLPAPRAPRAREP